MESNKILSTKNIFAIIFFAIMVMVLAAVISLWQTPKYKASAKLLTVFNQTNVDPYTASKTANYITGILGEVIYSDSFINSVMKSGTIEDTLGYGSENRQKKWKKMVETKILDNRGIIIVDAYGDNKYTTARLAEAIGNTLISQHGLYDGSSDSISIKMIDSPTIYEQWSMFKILRDILLGFLAGLLLGLTFVVIFPNHRLFVFQSRSTYQPNKPVDQPQKYQNYPIYQKPAQETTQPTYTPHSDNEWLKGYYPDQSQNGQNQSE